MGFRAFTLLAVVVLAVVTPTGAEARTGVVEQTVFAGQMSRSVGEDPPPPTFNEFYPDQRSLSDCLSSLPKPDCGSEARGGWAQTVVFLSILAGLAFITWRVIASSRRARLSRTPTSTTAPDGGGGAPSP